MENVVYCFEDSYNTNFINIILAASLLASKCGANVFRQISNQKEDGSDFEVLNKLGLKVISAEMECKHHIQNEKYVFADIFCSNPEFCYIGVSDNVNYQRVLEYLKTSSIKKAIIYSGSFVSADAPTTVAVWTPNSVDSLVVDPSHYKIHRAINHYLKGATSVYNAQIIESVFELKIKDSKNDVIALNSALILYASNVVGTVMEGLIKSYSVLNKGNAVRFLTFVK